MARPLLLDLCCCAGAAAKGYFDAGFDVIGVDIEPQPDYPYEFHQADALTFPLNGFDAYHASPPCQAYSPLNAYNHHEYPDLVEPLRERLLRTGRPFVIENVVQAPLREPVILCGLMFRLTIYRHRGFEAGGGLRLRQPLHSRHVARCARNGYLPTPERPFMSIHGGKHSRAWQLAAATTMGIPWLTARPGMDGLKIGIRQVCEAIPPVYTHYAGIALMQRCRESSGSG